MTDTTDQYAIWTRYVNPNGVIVRHVYGPYATRNRATTARNKMLRQAEADYDEHLHTKNLEIQVTKMIGNNPS